MKTVYAIISPTKSARFVEFSNVAPDEKRQSAKTITMNGKRHTLTEPRQIRQWERKSGGYNVKSLRRALSKHAPEFKGCVVV